MQINGYEIRSHTNLSGANLSGANLAGADLFGANLSGANLSGASLYKIASGRMIHMDISRQYILCMLQCDVVYYVAGCRTFTYEQAIHHWTNVSVQPEYVKAINANR